jgi:DNA-binding beta-propeller fold protein YncE
VDNDGNIWNSHFTDRTVTKLDKDGNILFTTPSGGDASRGVAVTPDNTVWIAHTSSNTVTRLASDGTILQTIPVGSGPTGVSVDSNGKVWVTNLNSSNVMRIDPDGAGPGMAAVDLTVDLGPGANPYNYSDMTGSLVGGITNPTGRWLSGAIDGGVAGTEWDKILWNIEAAGDIPADTTLTVSVRAADTVGGLSGLAWTDYDSGDMLGLTGRYAQILARFTRTGGVPGAPTAILSDVTLTTTTAPPIPLPASVWLLGGGMLALWRVRRKHA